MRACALAGPSGAASGILSRGGGRARVAIYRRRSLSVGRSPSRVRHVATPNTVASQVAGSPDHEKRSVGCRRRRPSSRDVVSASVYIVRVSITTLVSEIKAGVWESLLTGRLSRGSAREDRWHAPLPVCDLAAAEEKKRESDSRDRGASSASLQGDVRSRRKRQGVVIIRHAVLRARTNRWRGGISRGGLGGWRKRGQTREEWKGDEIYAQVL